MEIRISTTDDVNHILELISQGKEYMKANNIDQWQNGYPNKETILNDISNGESYILTRNGKIIGTFVYSLLGEINYDKIYEGKWLDNSPFAVIHRIVIDSSCKGNNFSNDIFQFVKNKALEKEIHSIKIDTHEDNASMRRFLEKSGFISCGLIYTSDGGKRVAYQLLF